MASDRPAGDDILNLKRWGRRAAATVLLALAVAVAASCLMFVDETELVVVERFGRIARVYDRPEDRGLQWKWPWPAEQTRRFDARMQLYDPPGREVFTKDRKNLVVDPFIVWRIAPSPAQSASATDDRPVVKFFRGMGGLELAEARLDSRLRAALASRVGQLDLSDLLAADSRDQPPPAGEGPLARLSAQIQSDLEALDDQQSDLAASLGIELVDVRIKRINLPAGNQQAVFERMKSERRKIADQYRSAGAAEDRMIRSRADRDFGELLARAEAEAERIRGEGEAEALATLNRAYAEDPEFAKFLESLDSLRDMLGEQTTLVLSSDSGLWKWLSDGLPPLEPGAESGHPPADATSPAEDPPALETATGGGP